MSATYPPTSTPLSPSVPVTASMITDSVLATPTHRATGTFTIISKTRITSSADPKDGLDLVRDTKTWSGWSSLCPRCEILPPSSSKNARDGPKAEGETGILQLGTRMNLMVSMEGKGLEAGAKTKRSGEVVTVLEEFSPDPSGDDGQAGGRKGWRIAWRVTDFPAWLLKAERVLEFVECKGAEQEGGWEFTTWETFGGLLGPVLKLYLGGTLVNRFGDYSRDLKRHFDGKVNTRRST